MLGGIGLAYRKQGVVLALIMLLCLRIACLAGEEVSFVRDGVLRIIDTDTRIEKQVTPGLIPDGSICYPTWISHDRLAFLYCSAKKRDMRGEYRVGIVDLLARKLDWIKELSDVSSIGFDADSQAILAERVTERKDGSMPRSLLWYKLNSNKVSSYIVYKGEAGESRYIGLIEPHRIVRIGGKPVVKVAMACTEGGDRFFFHDYRTSKWSLLTESFPATKGMFVSEIYGDHNEFVSVTPSVTDFSCDLAGDCCLSLTDYETSRSLLYVATRNQDWVKVHEVTGRAQFLSPGFSGKGGRLVYQKTNAWTLDEKNSRVWIVDLEESMSPKILCEGAYPQFRP